MNIFLLFTVGGPVLILSKHDSVAQGELLERLDVYGKFVAHKVPTEPVQSCYGAHYEHVMQDPKQSDHFKILDTDSKSIFANINFQLLGAPVYHQPGSEPICYDAQTRTQS